VSAPDLYDGVARRRDVRAELTGAPGDPAALEGVLGAAHAIDDAGLCSTCLAVRNLGLAATAEGLGVGWVSFYREAFLRDLLAVPDRVRPVAWLCVGPVTRLQEVPELERRGRRRGRPLVDTVHDEKWSA
jgi:5,6-dimethylbenzimidazole synthase